MISLLATAALFAVVFLAAVLPAHAHKILALVLVISATVFFLYSWLVRINGRDSDHRR